MRLHVVSLCIFLSVVGAGCRSVQSHADGDQAIKPPMTVASRDSSIGRFNPKVVMVSYDQGVGKTTISAAADRVGGKIVYDYANFNMLAIEKPDSMSMSRAVEYFSSIEGVLNAVPDQMCELNGASAEAL